MNFPLHQNDPILKSRPSIATYGCLFRSLCEIGEAHVGTALTAPQVIELFDWLVDNGHMRDEPGKQAWVDNHGAVINGALYYLGAEQTARYVWRADLADQGKAFGSQQRCNYFISQGRFDDWGISHFYRSDEYSDRMWDPYWPPKSDPLILSIRGYRL